MLIIIKMHICFFKAGFNRLHKNRNLESFIIFGFYPNMYEGIYLTNQIYEKLQIFPQNSASQQQNARLIEMSNSMASAQS